MVIVVDQQFDQEIYNVGVLIADMMQIVESSYPHSDNEIFLLKGCSHNAYEAV